MYIVFKCLTSVALFFQKRNFFLKVPFRDPMGSHF